MAMIRKGRPVAEPLGLGGEGLLPNLYDLAIFVLIAGVFVLIAHGAHEMAAPAVRLASEPVTLDPANLPEYALRTTLRMFAAILVSLLFTFVVATLAAKSRKAELVIVPALDILQSVPVLGFLTFTVVLFMRLFPGSQLGAECASIFAIFTSQAWNMAFSFYQSLRTVPADLDEVARHFRLSPWLRFWRLEVPFAAPGLIWNTMMSMSGGWFFVVASEAITVGDVTLKLPGIGSWLAVAIEQKNIAAVVMAVAAMAVVILAYDQLIFRPIVAWADKFRFEQTAALQRPQSWVYDLVRRGRLIKRIAAPLGWLRVLLPRPPVWRPRVRRRPIPPLLKKASDALWIAQLLAAFPANVLFPIAVAGIVYFRLDPNIWLSPLMVLGTQWYILFNVIAGASAFPTDLREAATLYRLRSAQWWRDVILPGIFPYYVTGALTASGGSWNASIVAEVATWGDTKLEAAGLGAYIAKATEAGDFPRVVLGIAVMSIFVVTFNRLVWRPMFRLAERRFRLD